MNQKLGDDSTPICGFKKIECVTNSMKSILSEKLKNITNGEKDLCNCLPACTQISYSHEISQANFDFLKLMRSTNASEKEMNPKYVLYEFRPYNNNTIQYKKKVKTTKKY